MSDFTNNNGKTISLIQQGSQTAINSITKIPATTPAVISVVMFIMICADDAHVLSRTCPACGSFVRGKKNATITPSTAAAFTGNQSSMNPKCI